MPTPQLLTTSIGETEVPSLVLKIKDNAVHAGLSVPLVLLKVLLLSNMELSTVSQNNNWLIVPPRTTVVMEDGPQKP